MPAPDTIAQQVISAAATPAASEAAPAVQQIVPQVAEADAALAAADAEHVEHIGRHAAGANPAPRQPPTAPRIRPRVRGEAQVEQLSFA